VQPTQKAPTGTPSEGRPKKGGATKPKAQNQSAGALSTLEDQFLEMSADELKVIRHVVEDILSHKK
jgi:hypothetical protein